MLGTGGSLIEPDEAANHKALIPDFRVLPCSPHIYLKTGAASVEVSDVLVSSRAADGTDLAELSDRHARSSAIRAA